MKLFACGGLAAACLVMAGAASAQVTQTYTYDGNGRLIGVSTSGSAGTNTASYSYDAANNRTQRVRSGTTSYAALEALPFDRRLGPDEALVSPNGRYTFALRSSGALELWREDHAMWSVADLSNGPDVITEAAGSILFLDVIAQPDAVWSVTDDGVLIATAMSDRTTLWSSIAGGL